MKKMALVLAVVFCLGLVFACGSTPFYRITLKNGQEYESKGKPSLDEKGDYITFTTTKDKTMYLKKADVLSVEEE